MKKYIMGLLLLTGALTANSLDEAIELCASGNGEICGSIGVEYQKQGDMKKAIKYLKKGCELNNGVACGIVGAQVLKDGDMAGSEVFLEKGCKLKNENSCGILKLINKATIRHLTKGCDNDEPASCNTLAKIIFNDAKSAEEVKKSVLLFKKACGLGDKEACFLEGKIQSKINRS